jgi:cell wall-associated NlpC family hydrolase
MPLSIEQRSRILKETYSWLGTPYAGWSCMKGKHGGVDCGQLVYAVFRNAGCLPELTLPRDYSLQVSQHRASTEYVDLVEKYFRPISESEVLPGDIVVFQFGHAYAHAAIIISWPEHCIQAIGGTHGVCAVHGNRTPKFKRAPKRFFTLRDEWC